MRLALLALVGCGPTLTDLPNTPGGDPIVPSIALYPYPSDYYLVDADTETGRRVAIPDAVLPRGTSEAMFAADDGYSRIPPILTWMPGGFDAATLPDAAGSLLATSPVQLLEGPDWTPVPILVELDQTPADDLSRALILRPHRALTPDTAHVVLLTDALRTADGAPQTAEDGFRALRDDLRTDSDAVEAWRDDFVAVTDAIDARGLDPETVVQGWSFHTRSEAQLTAPLLAMHDGMHEAALSDWTLVSDVQDGDRRLITGRFDVPMYLDEAHALVIGQGGLPEATTTRTVTFLLSIPDTVTEPRPVICFGHGFFSSKEEITWSSFDRGLHAWQASAIAFDFLGFSEDDALVTFARLGGDDLSGLATVVTEQMQSQAQFTALARLVTEQLAGDITADRGQGSFHPLDGGAVHYMGISNGGTQGYTLLAGSPEFRRGVLVVGGGGWAHMMQRATQFQTLGSVLSDAHPDPFELQLVSSLLQQVFDPIDAMSWADHLVTDRFPGRGEVDVTLHEALYDSQVANVTTHWVTRTAGLPLVTPSPIDVWGLDEVTAAPPGATVASALLIYDTGKPPNPEGNVPPPEENGAHGEVRELDAYVTQVGAFLEDGTVVQVCDGACDPD